MSERFTSVRPDGEATADRWAGALHLFDAVRGDAGADGASGGADTSTDTVLREETPLERWERAVLLVEERMYVAAAELLSGLVEQFPQHTAARLLLARAYYHSAQLTRAEEQLREVIARDPVEHYAHLMLGRTLQRQGRGEQAAPWLRMAGALAGDEAG